MIEIPEEVTAKEKASRGKKLLRTTDIIMDCNELM
jgi:hypothetical protein